MAWIRGVTLEDGTVFYKGQRVYHRRRDLFASIEDLDESHALVKYEWPWDPKRPAERHPLSELVNAFDVGGDGTNG